MHTPLGRRGARLLYWRLWHHLTRISMPFAVPSYKSGGRTTRSSGARIKLFHEQLLLLSILSVFVYRGGEISFYQLRGEYISLGCDSSPSVVLLYKKNRRPCPPLVSRSRHVGIVDLQIMHALPRNGPKHVRRALHPDRLQLRLALDEKVTGKAERVHAQRLAGLRERVRLASSREDVQVSERQYDVV